MYAGPWMCWGHVKGVTCLSLAARIGYSPRIFSEHATQRRCTENDVMFEGTGEVKSDSHCFQFNIFPGLFCFVVFDFLQSHFCIFVCFSYTCHIPSLFTSIWPLLPDALEPQILLPLIFHSWLWWRNDHRLFLSVTQTVKKLSVWSVPLDGKLKRLTSSRLRCTVTSNCHWLWSS